VSAAAAGEQRHFPGHRRIGAGDIHRVLMQRQFRMGFGQPSSCSFSTSSTRLISFFIIYAPSEWFDAASLHGGGHRVGVSSDVKNVPGDVMILAELTEKNAPKTVSLRNMVIYFVPL
jgi:hypothetical protein